MHNAVQVLGLGGTIAMDFAGHGAVPVHGVDAIVGRLASSGDTVQSRQTGVMTDQVTNKPGASLTWDDIITCVESAHEAADRGARGVVVLMGTDTLEEVAFIFHLLWGRPTPVVVAGAMRHRGMASDDGPANVAQAIAVAAASSAQGRGPMVVLNNQIHSARWIRKTHTHHLQALSSPTVGPMGEVVEDEVVFYWTAPLLPAGGTLRSPRRPVTPPHVPILEFAVGDDGTDIDVLVASGIDGLVIAASGAGHLSAPAAERCAAAALSIPVVLASRTGAGPILTRTYSFPGSESDLLSKGLIEAGYLDARKARIALILALLQAEGEVADTMRAIDRTLVDRG